MFEFVRAEAPPTVLVTDADLDRIEQAFDCRLPADYWSFITTFGPGDLDGFIRVYSPDDVIESTCDVRDIWTEAGTTPPYYLAFFDRFANAATYFTSDDLDHIVVIFSSADGDQYILLPGDLPHYFALPRHLATVGDAGATLESLLAYLDPRTLYYPQARRLVVDGVVREDDGYPDGTPYLQRFRPEGYPPPDPRHWVDRQLVWGHLWDPLVTTKLPFYVSYTRAGPPPTTIEVVHDYMARYPLFTLLDAIAQHDRTTRFKMKAQQEPYAEFTVPRFEATLEADGGPQGHTLYVHVPEEHAAALWRWLAAEVDAVGGDVPPGFLPPMPQEGSGR